MKCLAVIVIISFACINICFADKNKTSNVLPSFDEEFEDVESTEDDDFELELTGNLSKLFAVCVSDVSLSGTMVKVVATLKAAYFNLENVTRRLTVNSKPSDFNDIIRSLDNSFEPILASVNETRNLLSDSVIKVKYSVKSLIYFHLTNGSGDAIAKNVADVTAAVAQFMKSVQAVIAALVLTIDSGPKNVAEAASALVIILNTTIDFVYKIIARSSENFANLPVKVQQIYAIAAESLSLALSTTDEIMSGLISVIKTESNAGLIRNLDNVLGALIPVSTNFIGNVNIITIFVASFNINTLTLEIPKDISPYVSGFSIAFKRLFRQVSTSIKELRNPLRTLEISAANMGTGILKVIQYIIKLRLNEVAGNAVETFSNAIKVRLENLVVILNKFASAIMDTTPDKLNRTVAGLLQAVVTVTSFIVNHVNDFHAQVINVGGYVNLYVVVRDFMATLTDFMLDTEKETVILPENKTIE